MSAFRVYVIMSTYHQSYLFYHLFRRYFGVDVRCHFDKCSRLPNDAGFQWCEMECNFTFVLFNSEIVCFATCFPLFQHSYAVIQISLGTDIYTVSKMLTHKNVTTTQIYADLVNSKKRETANKISLK